MEMTNELNKFLSYIHMGNSVYRIYYNESKKFSDSKLETLLTEIMEIFKKHEELITSSINKYDESATNSLTAAGVLGVYKEKLRIFDSPLDICLQALKTTNMGTISAIKFLSSNKNLHKVVFDKIAAVIDDYGEIEKKIIKYSIENL